MEHMEKLRFTSEMPAEREYTQRHTHARTRARAHTQRERERERERKLCMEREINVSCILRLRRWHGICIYSTQPHREPHARDRIWLHHGGGWQC